MSLGRLSEPKSGARVGMVPLVLALVGCIPPLGETTKERLGLSAASGDAPLVRAPNGNSRYLDSSFTEASAARGKELSCLKAAIQSSKLVNPTMVRAHFERARHGERVALYVRLDPKTAPADEALRKEGLRATGGLPQTIAGSVATVLVTEDELSALLALPWVVTIETPGLMNPR